MMQLRLLRVFEMAPLTSRQTVAQALKDEIHRLGGYVLNPMPLPPSEKLRFQFLAGPACNDSVEKLRALGWEPVLRNSGLRFCLSGTAEPCNTYEIQIEGERQPVYDDRVIRGEIATKERSSYEVEQVKRYLGLTGPKK